MAMFIAAQDWQAGSRLDQRALPLAVPSFTAATKSSVLASPQRSRSHHGAGYAEAHRGAAAGLTLFGVLLGIAAKFNEVAQEGIDDMGATMYNALSVDCLDL